MVFLFYFQKNLNDSNLNDFKSETPRTLRLDLRPPFLHHFFLLIKCHIGNEEQANLQPFFFFAETPNMKNIIIKKVFA